jgi:hypothetical protein
MSVRLGFFKKSKTQSYAWDLGVALSFFKKVKMW